VVSNLQLPSAFSEQTVAITLDCTGSFSVNMSLEAPLEDSMTIMHWQVDEPGVIRKVGSMQGQLIDGILVSINFEKNTNILMLSKKNMISRYHVPN
jgi:carbohydrate-binding DOMON domain-containing protein